MDSLWCVVSLQSPSLCRISPYSEIQTSETHLKAEQLCGCKKKKKDAACCVNFPQEIIALRFKLDVRMKGYLSGGRGMQLRQQEHGNCCL